MTNKGLLTSLSEQEWLLHSETERAALADLDEDQLVELHTRVRRARDKYVKQYRRGASALVPVAGARGKARPQNRRAADKAELFEEALSRVSTSLAAAARRSAAQLRDERLALARDTGGPGPKRAVAEPAGVAGPAKAKGKVASTKSPISRKNAAATQASGARRQAKRDSR
jgi:hypothetical protein